MLVPINTHTLNETDRSRWQCGLKYRYAAIRLLGWSNPAVGVDVCLLCLLCVLQVAASATS
jgi:hypothetical protein